MLKNIDINEIKNIALKAGKAIMQVYERDFEIYEKEDKSPLSEADILSNTIICDSLAKFNLPILSEENSIISFEERKNWEYFFLVDPLDGTKEFIKRNGEFTVNIALIHKQSPVLGVVYAPALNLMYSAKKGEGAFKNDELLPLALNKDTYKIVASKSHMSDETKDFIDKLEVDKKKELISMGSSLKLCLVASAEADIYPRLAPTMEWDTAAADAIVREAKKMSYDFYSKKPLLYNKENLKNPYFVVY
ncbi:adenosine-3'(2'),5'-bisphosphate nucleotidase [Campylobacter avium LMG 24591]|uniref:3'(2'),5'-bisphosphate nucleotidase CysQ n=1 Tax=Campylobacter avium LMG 24591 TaxID=522484 RepID=A0A222MZ59_9BACT|nr:3'(2'),5'-bisphosphate nucleotidase CysQ [Campylobacter avium]ASQ31091.1 adenosine-3'(2'),5'-bisphosphate nucleotidase [Campylobacter avium LMG 24591]OYD78474.1 adenosine-3'(2'),5'-bisphosphate nucleotidase [Campylobacter avium]